MPSSHPFAPGSTKQVLEGARYCCTTEEKDTYDTVDVVRLEVAGDFNNPK